MLKIQKYLYYLLFFLTPFIMFKDTSELFEFNKMIFIYMVVTAIVCVWCYRMVQEGKILFKRTPFDLFIGLFFLAQVLSTLFSIDVHTSFFGYYGRFNGGLLSLIAYLLLFYSFIAFLDEQKASIVAITGNILKISVISSTLVIFWGLPGKLGYDLSCLVFSGKLNNACWTAQFDPAARMFSTLGQPNWFGSYLAIIFFTLLYFFLVSPTSKKIFSHPAFYFFLLFLNMVSIFFTNSRSSLMAVIAALGAVFVWIVLRNRQLDLPHLKKKLILFSLGIIILTLYFKTGIRAIDKYLSLDNYFKTAVFQSNSGANKQSEIPVQTSTAPTLNITDSFNIRQIVWKGAISLGRLYPLFGTGLETFAYSYYFVRPAEHNLTSEWDYLYNKAHNEYLNYFATTGFLGTSTYLLLILFVTGLGLYWIIFKHKPKNDKHHHLTWLQLCLLASWVTILITNLVGFSTTTINLYFYIIPALLYGIEIAKNHAEKENNQKKSIASARGGNLMAYAIIILATVFSLQFFISYWLADTKYALAENYAKANDYQSAYALLARALQLHREHVYEDKLSFYLANLAFIAAYQKNDKLVAELMKSSENYNASSLRSSPQNILYWKTRIKNLYIFYQISLNKSYLARGIDALKEAERISPTDPKLPYFSATYYSLLFDDEKNASVKKAYQDKSLSSIDSSINLKKDYFESYYLKAQLLKKYKMINEAKAEYELILEKISPGNKQIIEELKNLK